MPKYKDHMTSEVRMDRQVHGNKYELWCHDCDWTGMARTQREAWNLGREHTESSVAYEVFTVEIPAFQVRVTRGSYTNKRSRKAEARLAVQYALRDCDYGDASIVSVPRIAVK